MGNYDGRMTELLQELAQTSVSPSNPAFARLRGLMSDWIGLRDRLLDNLLSGLQNDAEKPDGIEADWLGFVLVARKLLADIIERGKPDARTETRLDDWWKNLVHVEDRFLEGLGKLPAAARLTKINGHVGAMEHLLIELASKWEAVSYLAEGDARLEIADLEAAAVALKSETEKISAALANALSEVVALRERLDSLRKSLDANLVSESRNSTYVEFLKQPVDRLFANDIPTLVDSGRSRVASALSATTAACTAALAEIERRSQAYASKVGNHAAILRVFLRDRTEVSAFDRSAKKAAANQDLLASTAALTAWASAGLTAGQKKDADMFALLAYEIFKIALADVEARHTEFQTKFSGKFEGAVTDGNVERLTRNAEARMALDKVFAAFNRQVFETLDEQVESRFQAELKRCFRPFIDNMTSSLPRELLDHIQKRAEQASAKLTADLASSVSTVKAQLGVMKTSAQQSNLILKFPRAPLFTMLG